MQQPDDQGVLERSPNRARWPEWHLANAHALGKRYFYTDQFSNIGSLDAHLHETGPEIAA